MLRFLSIQNIVLIDKIEINFGKGLCVLTGETGAGKSIILDSLGLVIGERADYSLRPNNEQNTEVVAVFSNISNSYIKEKLLELGINETEELILKRLLTKDGKSKSYINDHIVSLNTLKNIGTRMIEIESQFSEQGLLDSTTHINVLDDFINDKQIFENLKAHWNNWKKAENELKKIMDFQNSLNQKKDLIEYEFSEISKLNPKLGEYNELLNNKKKILNSTKIEESIKKVLSNFTKEDKNGIEELISENISNLEKIKDCYTDEIENIIKSLDSILIDIQENKSTLEGFLNLQNESSQSLESIDDNIYFYNKLSKKHNCTKDELVEVKEKLEKAFDIKDNNVILIKEKELLTSENKKKYLDFLSQISEKRKLFGKKIDDLINKELPELKLENSEFRTFIYDEDQYGPSGNNKVLFKIKTNQQSEFEEIKKISSGGELCRFALAMKVVSSKKNQTSLVFDEVDSGIGGAVASAVGERLRRLGSNRQVIVVTHSPQVAALGDEHFIVVKNKKNNVESTSITKLDNPHRVKEIARMISGKEVTKEAEIAASKLMDIL